MSSEKKSSSSAKKTPSKPAEGEKDDKKKSSSSSKTKTSSSTTKSPSKDSQKKSSSSSNKKSSSNKDAKPSEELEALQTQIQQKNQTIEELKKTTEDLRKDADEMKKNEEKKKEEYSKEIAELKKKYESQIDELKKSIPPKEPEPLETDDITYEPKTGKIVKINGEWKGISAGGSFSNLSWRYNPQIFIRPSRSCTVTIRLTQPEASTYTGIGWYIFQSEYEEPRRLLIATEDDMLAKSGLKRDRHAEATFALKKVKEPYILIPCTHAPEEELTFTVTLESDAPLTAQLISKEQEWPQPTILSSWSGETAGGHHKHDSFVKNPQYLMKIEKQTPLKLLLLQEKFEEFDNIGLYVISTEENRKQKIAERSVASDKSLTVSLPAFEDPNVYCVSLNLKPGSYVIIPTTFDDGQEAPFKLLIMTNELIPPLRELADAASIQINGNWQGETAGGCLNDVRAWRQNVQYLLSTSKDVEVSIKLKQTSSSGGTGELASVGFYIFTGGRRIIKPKKKNIFYKSKFVKSRDGVVEKLKLPASDEPYILVPCTYTSGQEGAYAVQIYSDDSTFTDFVTLETLPQDRDLERLVAKGEWEGVTAGGCLDYCTWRNNPQFLIDVGKSTELTVFLTCKSDNEELTPGFYIVNAPNTTNLRVRLKPEEVLAKAAFRQGLEVQKTLKLEPGRYNIIPCTYKLGQTSKFEMSVWVAEFGIVELKPIPAGILSMKGEWGPTTSGGCINDVKSWWNNPHYYLAVKQDVELVAVLIQNPGKEVDENNMLEIGMYITNSDGDGNPKTNEEKDLISKAAFSPDRDVVTTCTVPSSYWPYVITPCTFKPGVLGKFEIQLVMDESSLEYLEFSKDNIVINPAEVVGAGEDPEMREIRKRFKPLAARCVELVQLTESSSTLPEYFKYIGRTLLQTVSQFQDSIVAWGENREPDWWLEGYEEEEYYEEEEKPKSSAPAPAPPPPPSGGPPPPPPPKAPAINFSKPVKSKMVDSERTSNMTQDMIDELENKKTLFVDELLLAVKGGLKNLRKVEIPPKPIVEDPTVCAFNIEILNKRRAALEGLNDKPETWSDNDEWNDVEED